MKVYLYQGVCSKRWNRQCLVMSHPNVSEGSFLQWLGLVLEGLLSGLMLIKMGPGICPLPLKKFYGPTEM